MSVGGMIAVYFVVWWTVLFITLPFGVRSQIEDDSVIPGSEPGAPARPLLRKKMVITTVVSIPLVGLIWLWNVSGSPI